MGTAWIPMTRMEPRSWLLGNGEIIKEPALEMTSTGRKIRVVGQTDSYYAKDVDTLLTEAVKTLASTKGTHVWMEVTHPIASDYQSALGFDYTQTKAKFHLVHSPTDKRANTRCWWRFKDPNSQFEVLVVAQMAASNNNVNNTCQTTTVQVIFPMMSPHGPYRTMHRIADSSFRDPVDIIRHVDTNLHYKWQEFVRDNPPDWPIDLIDTVQHAHSRAGTVFFTKAVRDMEGIDTIQVPDFRDPFTPAWLDLELYETNVNAELLSDLAEYLDGAPTIEQAAELYQQMLDTLRAAGIIVNAKSSNDFLAAMLAGEKSTLNMEVHNLAEERQSVDPNHKLSVHLPTGTFIVSCTHQEVDKTQVVEKWEEAKTMASLTGQEDELLAYARAYAREHGKTRTANILKERMAT